MWMTSWNFTMHNLHVCMELSRIENWTFIRLVESFVNILNNVDRVSSLAMLVLWNYFNIPQSPKCFVSTHYNPHKHVLYIATIIFCVGTFHLFIINILWAAHSLYLLLEIPTLWKSSCILVKLLVYLRINYLLNVMETFIAFTK